MSDSKPDASRREIRLLKPEEAADYLQVSRFWLMDQVRAGKLPCRRYGSRIVRFAEEDLEEFKRIGRVPARRARGKRSA